MTAQRDKRELLDLIEPLRRQNWTFAEIGKHIGLSKERVRQLWRQFFVDDGGSIRAK